MRKRYGFIASCAKRWTIPLMVMWTLLVFVVPQQAYANPDAIRLGMSAPFTGTSRNIGSELYRGAEAYFDFINSTGGINGRPIELIAYDDQYEPELAIKNTLRLLHQDQVFTLFNYVGTAVMSRVLPLLEKFKDEKAYLFFPFSGAQPLRSPPYDQLTFNLRASYREETAGLVNHLVDTGHRRIAVLYQGDAYGRDGWVGIRSALAARGAKLVGEATYRRNSHFTDSFVPQVAILERSTPDAIICIAAYAPAAGFIRDARREKFKGPIANVSFAGFDNIISLLQAAEKEDGRDYTTGLINSTVVSDYADERIPAIREYRQLMQQYAQKKPHAPLETDYKGPAFGSISLEGFLNAKLLVTILRRMGKDPVRADIHRVVSGIENLELGIGAPVTFRGSNQGQHSVYYKTYQDGITPISDWARWQR